MLTCLLLVILCIGIALAIIVITGVVAIAPILLGIIGLLAVDYFVLKKIFGKKKGGKKGD